MGWGWGWGWWVVGGGWLSVFMYLACCDTMAYGGKSACWNDTLRVVLWMGKGLALQRRSVLETEGHQIDPQKQQRSNLVPTIVYTLVSGIIGRPSRALGTYIVIIRVPLL